jgi:divalent metal cation (Fe/Co/Zn/Cd) transporter
VSGRRSLVTAAIRVSSVSVVWSLLVGTLAVIAGVSAHALALVALGLESIVDGSASVVLVWRFEVERRDPDRARRVERVAHWFNAVTLLVVAVYVAAQAIRALATGAEPDGVTAGIVIAVASMVVLPFLAVAKLRLARRLQSAALRGDGILTATGAVLASAVLLGLVVNETFGWWWSDAGAAVLIAAFLGREAWNSFSN